MMGAFAVLTDGDEHETGFVKQWQRVDRSLNAS
jgi:hypothetical protein